MSIKIKTCVVIPCFKVRNQIEKVVSDINKLKITKIFLIDDNCPENTGKFMKSKKIKNLEITILKKNLGVGGATLVGFEKAIKKKFDIVFKIDGDGQHDPKDIPKFLKYLKDNKIKFCKGTRFYNKRERSKIPFIRKIGNILLTYMSRINCRNFDLNDVVNGFLGIKVSILRKIDFKLISKDFFFEEDLLFRICMFEKNIKEIPIKTVYNYKSNLNPLKIVVPFFFKHLKNFIIILFK